MSRSAATADPFDALWTRRPPNRDQYVHDTFWAAILLVATLASVALYTSAGFPDAAHPVVSAHWAVAMTLPLALRRRFPATIAILLAIVYTAGLVLQVPESLFNQICLFLAIYTVGAWGRDRRRALVVRLLIVVAMLGWLISTLMSGDWMGRAIPATESTGGILSPYAAESALALVVNVLYFGSAYVFGNASWQSARRLEALEARTAELDDERERSSRQAVTSERLRIARELHDVVAHHVSVMGVQAGAARRVLARDPEKAAQSLSAIENDARSAIEELHRILVALRAEEAANPPTEAASTRGVSQLEELVTASIDSGLPTSLHTLGTPREIPATAALSLYRIAQESLTNVRKHAGPGARAEVRLRYLPAGVDLEIEDDGGVGPHPGAPTSCGLGQTGMRERAAAVGGWIETGPQGEGYLVHAHVPLAPVRSVVEETAPDPVASSEVSWGRQDRASGGRA